MSFSRWSAWAGLPTRRCGPDLAGGWPSGQAAGRLRWPGQRARRGWVKASQGWRCHQERVTNSSLTAHPPPPSWASGAGAGDGGCRRGAHEEQPQRLSAAAEPQQPRRPLSPSRNKLVRGRRRGPGRGEERVLPTVAQDPHPICEVVPPAGLGSLRFAAAGTWHSAFGPLSFCPGPFRMVL